LNIRLRAFFLLLSRDSSLGTLTKLRDGPRFDSRYGQDIFLFYITTRLALGLKEPPLEWVPGAVSLEVMWQGEDDHSNPSDAHLDGKTESDVWRCRDSMKEKCTGWLKVTVIWDLALCSSVKHAVSICERW
jgi:hypothetical protein